MKPGTLVVVLLALVAAACSSSGSSSASCTANVKGYVGGADECTIMADCGKTQRRFLCSQNDGGLCDCTVNGSIDKSVPFDAKYCAYNADAGNDPNVQLARAACGW